MNKLIVFSLFVCLIITTDFVWVDKTTAINKNNIVSIKIMDNNMIIHNGMILIYNGIKHDGTIIIVVNSFWFDKNQDEYHPMKYYITYNNETEKKQWLDKLGVDEN
jgi:hypothetical protein